MRVDEFVGARAAAAEHEVEQVEGGGGVGVGGIGGEHSGVEVDVGEAEAVEDETGVTEVGEDEGTEADELEGVELSLAMAGGDEEGMELLEMAQIGAFVQEGQDVFVEGGLSVGVGEHQYQFRGWLAGCPFGLSEGL